MRTIVPVKQKSVRLYPTPHFPRVRWHLTALIYIEYGGTREAHKMCHPIIASPPVGPILGNMIGVEQAGGHRQPSGIEQRCLWAP